jgi:hypothetical protein
MLLHAILLDEGINNYNVLVNNNCGSQNISATIIYKPAEVVVVVPPCVPPQLNIGLTAVDRDDASHELRGTATNVKNKSDIKVTVNGNPYEGPSEDEKAKKDNSSH